MQHATSAILGSPARSSSASTCGGSTLASGAPPVEAARSGGGSVGFARCAPLGDGSDVGQHLLGLGGGQLLHPKPGGDATEGAERQRVLDANRQPASARPRRLH